jgi:uncharacterized protein YwqG
MPVGASRLGGSPDLPADFEWPCFDGRPLAFIAQLNLSLLARWPQVLPLPANGSLVFFYDSEQATWGFDPNDKGSAHVAYLPGDWSSWRKRPIPDDIPESGQFHPSLVDFYVDPTLPDPSSPLFVPPLRPDENDTLGNIISELHEDDDKPIHRLGGHPDVVQGPMELECQLVTNNVYCGDSKAYQDPRVKELAPGAADWRLLLQIDSDDEIGFMWGDGGRIYFWIREQDLKDRRFDRTWLILQCY